MESVMDIEWQEGAVCFAHNMQYSYPLIPSITKAKDFQLNTIKQGDHIEASELDTEQKYNDAVEVFGLFGYEPYKNHKGYNKDKESLSLGDWHFCYSNNGLKRKLTFNQLMAIGELKRLEIEREKREARAVFVEALDETVAHAEKLEDAVNKPSHYQFFEGVEVIEIIASSMTREQFKGYCLGNRIKYRLRAGNKDKLEQEIAKSDKYVELYDEHKHLCK